MILILGRMKQAGVRLHHVTENGGMQFQTYELFISGYFQLICSNCSWSQVTQTAESETVDKGGPPYMSLWSRFSDQPYANKPGLALEEMEHWKGKWVTVTMRYEDEGLGRFWGLVEGEETQPEPPGPPCSPSHPAEELFHLETLLSRGFHISSGLQTPALLFPRFRTRSPTSVALKWT